MPEPLHLCHVITSTRMGGAETQLLGFIAHTQPQGVKNLVVSLEPKGSLAPTMEAAGAQVQTLDLRPGMGALVQGLGLRRLGAILEEHRPRLIQTWMYHADLLGLLASSRTGKPPVVWGLRCSDLDLSLFTRLVVRTCARLSRRPAAVVANSRAGLTHHQGLGYAPERMRVIPNGFDTKRLRPDPEARAQVRAELGLGEDDLLVGQVANFKPVKDPLGFVTAAALSARETPQAHFMLIGQGMTPANPGLALCRQPPLAGRIHLLGLRDDVPRLLAALDLFVLSSRSEGFPNVVAEAMAAGLPVVATDAGDCRELLGPAGEVVPPGDPQALSRAMGRLLALAPDERKALGAAARQRIEDHYSLRAMAEAYLSLYEEALGSGS
ncbi:MAG: glycosyltransferase [Desulfarculaceae bacterium]|jgi:glycosyltransferase involved in cell wall biosynthesis